MATQNVYPGDGVTQEFSITFPFQSVTDIEVYVNDVSVPFTLASLQRVRLASIPENGTRVRVQRSTGFAVPRVDFQDGSVLTEDDLDQSQLQLFYRLQEIADTVINVAARAVLYPDGESGITLPSRLTLAGKFLAGDAEGRIYGAVAPVAGSDAAIRLDLADNTKGGRLVSVKKSLLASTARTAQSVVENDVPLSLLDYGALPTGGSLEVVTAVAMAAIGSNRRTLVIPAGTWTATSALDLSGNSTMALRIATGATIDHGTFPLVLPDGVQIEPGARIIGSGTVSIKRKNALSLLTPPGGFIETGNDARGVGALASLTGGHNNLAWGHDALARLQTGVSNIAIGNRAGYGLTNFATATSAYGSYLPLGSGNILIGDSTGRDLTSGYENTFIGPLTGQQVNTGRWNTAIGAQSMIVSGPASNNVTVGAYNLTTSTSDNNVAIGWAAGEVQQSGTNVFIGYVAGNANVSGTLNTVVGTQGLQFITTGVENTVLGNEALKNLTTGSYNVAIGAYALGNARGAYENSVAVGRNALLNANNSAGQNTALGSGAANAVTTEVNITALGFNAQVTGSNQVQLGDSRTTPYAFQALQTRSDRRDKTDIRPTQLGLDFVKRLIPVDYRLDLREDYRKPLPAELAIPVESPSARPLDPEYDAEMAKYLAAVAQRERDVAAWQAANDIGAITHDGSHRRERYHHGLIAQDVEDLIRETGVDFGGFQDHKVAGGADVKSVGYEELIAPLIKSVQELSALVDTLRAEVAELKGS